jgi:hypothetical protein
LCRPSDDRRNPNEQENKQENKQTNKETNQQTNKQTNTQTAKRQHDNRRQTKKETNKETRNARIRADPLTGIQRHVQAAAKRIRQVLNHAPPADSDDADITLDANEEAIAIRAAIFQEGREIIASQPESLDLAFEILKMKSAAKDIKLEAHGAQEEVYVDQLEYTQASCGKCFKNGWPLQKLIDELNSGEVDPLRHPDLELEVVRKLHGRHYRYYSNDNRRLYCLKEHQQHVEPRKVRVSAKLYDWSPAFDRCLDRVPERERANLSRDYIRVRGQHQSGASGLPPWRER